MADIAEQSTHPWWAVTVHLARKQSDTFSLVWIKMNNTMNELVTSDRSNCLIALSSL